MVFCGAMQGSPNNVTYMTLFRCVEPTRAQYVIVQGHSNEIRVCELEVYSRIAEFLL